jgi:hypothetical protein
MFEGWDTPPKIQYGLKFQILLKFFPFEGINLLVEHFQAQKQFFNKDVNEGKNIRMPNNFIPLIRDDEHKKGTKSI